MEYDWSRKRNLSTTSIDDPFPDPAGLVVPESAPTRPPDNSTRIAEDEDPLEELPEEEAEQQRRKKEAEAAALTLEMVGDLPFANVRPPENVLFVCKLNPVTRDEDLELIFSRFGTIMSCQVIRDKKTGDSLQYAFIEFDKREEAEQVRVYYRSIPEIISSKLLPHVQRFIVSLYPIGSVAIHDCTLSFFWHVLSLRS